MADENTNLEAQDVDQAGAGEEEDYDLDFDADDDFEDLNFDDDEESDEEAEEPESEKFTVKFNGEEKELNREELIAAAQKGLNYDKIKGRLDSWESGTIHQALKAAAGKAGMSIDDYAKYMLENSEADAQLEAERELRNKYPGAPAEMIRELAGYRTKAAESGTKAQEQSAEEKAWAEALREYPDIKVDEIPEEVQEDIRGGATPLMAYMRHEIRELKKQQKENAAKEKNAKNKKSSLGSLSSSGSSAKKDPFLEGYD